MHLERLLPAPTLLLLSFTTPAWAGIRYVDASLATGANDGTTWADAFQGSAGLQAALAIAASGDQIWVADGTYKPTAGADRTVSFALLTGVKLYGGFAGGETDLRQRDLAANVSILSADLAGDDGLGNLGENSYHVVRGNSAGASAVLDGFTIVGGNANGGTVDDDRGGGLLLVSASHATISRCRVVGNRCNFGGGAGYVRGSDPTFVECSFEQNVGGSYGGAFDMFESLTPEFHRCTFFGNSAARAGGVEIFSTSAHLYDCLFQGNTSTGSGGGGAIFVGPGSAPSIRGCTVVGNLSNVHAAAGLLTSAGGTSVANSIFYFNTGPGGAQGTANQVTGGSVSYSCVQGGLAGTGNISADPLFVDFAGGDHRLAAASPCIDAGSNALVPAASSQDLDLTPRIEDAPAIPDTGAGGAPVVDMGAYEEPNDLYETFCFGDGTLPTPCPCGNTAPSGHGCLNSDVFNGSGAVLIASGAASPDTVTLTASEMLPTSLCVFLQGNAPLPSGVVFGDGVRCVGGALKRIGVKTASGGAASYPEPGDPSISARSSALGDPIASGTMRWYQAWYRDADPSFCPPPQGQTWNASGGVAIAW